MRNRILAGIIFFSLVIGYWSLVINGEAAAMGSPVPRRPVTAGMLIDDFESGAIPAWWKFDGVSVEVISTAGLNEGDYELKKEGGLYALKVTGKNKKIDWYVGGGGLYFARPGRDLTLYRNLEMNIYGYGPGQGTVKIELYDDDNYNWEIEQNSQEAFAPIYDDRFAAEVRVDWFGWKKVIIPLTDFIDTNAGVGDDLWNPGQVGQSGGLLQLQLISISSNKRSAVQYAIDNIRLTR